MAGRIDSRQRKRIEKQLTAALIALYLSGKQKALLKLDKSLAAELTPAQRSKIEAFAKERAALIQSGTNTYLSNSKNDVGKNATPAELASAEAARLKKVGEHNAGVLIPMFTRWAANNSQVDTYQEQDAADTNGDGEPQLWQWTQMTDFPDDCTEADAASPDTLDNLMSIGGGIPPVHSGCQCTLEPV